MCSKVSELDKLMWNEIDHTFDDFPLVYLIF